MVRFLPRFITDVNKCKCTKEWVISPSSLNEGFLKVVAENRNVEEADEQLREREEKEKRKQVKLCAICGMNPAEKGASGEEM